MLRVLREVLRRTTRELLSWMSSHRRSSVLSLPHALSSPDVLRERIDGRCPALFLDYDGVLTPIVDDPTAATLDDDVRAAVRRAAQHMPVAVISGRDLDDVRAMVGLDDLAYAGSHGFDMLLADGEREQYGEQHLDALDDVERRLHDQLDQLDGVYVERKRFAIAVHTRLADDFARDRATQAVADAADAVDGLAVTGGKNIEELRPDVEWDKGRALQRLVDVLDLDVDRYAAVYVGDDDTDEDAFAVLVDRGAGVVVADDDRPTDAHVRLRDPSETAGLLDLLVGLATKGTP